MAFQPRHKCGCGINEVVEVIPSALGSDDVPIGYTFTIEGKPAESVLRFQDGPYIPAPPPTSANSGHEASGAPGTTSTANGITPEAALAAIGDHLEALTAKTGDPELGEAFDHVRHAIARLNEHRQRVEQPKPARASMPLSHPSATDLLQRSNRRLSCPAPETSKAVRGSSPAVPSSRRRALPPLRKRQRTRGLHRFRRIPL